MANEVERFKVPAFAVKNTLEYPAVANTVSLLQMTFYCINCRRKAECTFINNNVGPFCETCLNEIKATLSSEKLVETVNEIRQYMTPEMLEKIPTIVLLRLDTLLVAAKKGEL